MSERPGYVYRAFAHDGALLYIGASLVPGQRFANHKSQTDWWDEVASLTIERYDSRELALAVESNAIRAEKPRYNVMTDSGIVNPAEVLRRAEARREAQHEIWLERTYVPATPVCCTNCGHRPERLPNGTTVDDLICKACRCPTLKHARRSHLHAVPPGQEALDLEAAA